MTRRRSRAGRVSKWVGLIACVFVVGLFLLSTWRIVSWRGRQTNLVLRSWRIDVFWLNHDPSSEEREYWDREFRISKLYVSDGIVSLWWFDWARHPSGKQSRVNVPLSFVFTALAIPTAILWRRDRRFRQGHCQQCGYNLTGNESGKCPECGTEVEPV